MHHVYGRQGRYLGCGEARSADEQDPQGDGQQPGDAPLLPPEPTHKCGEPTGQPATGSAIICNNPACTAGPCPENVRPPF
jgi:hypothetical protein